MPVSSVAAYSEVNATIRALYAQLLTPDVMQALTLSPDFDSLLSQLSKTAYAPQLNLPRALLTPRRTVYQLQGRLAELYEKLMRRTPQPGRGLIQRLWQLYEVDNLKATLRGVEQGASWDQVLHLLAPIPRFATLSADDFQSMLRTGTVAKAIERTRGTPYYDILVYALPRYESEKTLFPLEIALDLDYRRRLWARILQLKGDDRNQAMDLLGRMLDADNLLWAIRFRVYHKLSQEEIINYTLPQGYQVADTDIRAIADGADIATVIRRIYPNVAEFAELQTEADGAPVPPGRWLGTVEETLADLLRARCRKVLHSGSPFHIGVPLAYLLLSEHELRALTAIIEAKASTRPLNDLLAAYLSTGRSMLQVS